MQGQQSLQKGLFRRLAASRRTDFSLRMAPMIDMIFLLLIFFLLTAKFRPVENFLPFKLPVANATAQSIGKAEPLKIHIAPSEIGCVVAIEAAGAELAKIAIADDTESLANLMQEINNCLKQQQRYVSDPVEITCGAEVKWQYLSGVYNILYGMQMTDITFRLTE